MSDVDWQMSGETLNFLLKGQELNLFVNRALYWRQEKTLVIADVHLGKSATFRSFGIAMPSGTTMATLQRLTLLLWRTGAERLLILGDLLHARAGQTKAIRQRVTEWRREHSNLAIDLVLGNHDRQAGRPPHAWGIQCHDKLVEPPFVWLHEPQKSAEGYVVGGHIHPGVYLRGPGESLTLPCFAFGPDFALLPAFGDFTGYAVIQPRKGDTVFVVAEDTLLRFDT